MAKTHCEIIYGILSDKIWHNVIEISKVGFPGCVNVAIRSRVTDLKRKLLPQNKTIISRIAKNRQAEYRLVEIGELPL